MARETPGSRQPAGECALHHKGGYAAAFSKTDGRRKHLSRRAKQSAVLQASRQKPAEGQGCCDPPGWIASHDVPAFDDRYEVLQVRARLSAPSGNLRPTRVESIEDDNGGRVHEAVSALGAGFPGQAQLVYQTR